MIDQAEVARVLERNGWDVREAFFEDTTWSLHAERNLAIPVSIDIKGQEDGSADMWAWFESEKLDLDLEQEVDDIGDLIYLLHYYGIAAKEKATFSPRVAEE